MVLIFLAGNLSRQELLGNKLVVLILHIYCGRILTQARVRWRETMMQQVWVYLSIFFLNLLFPPTLF